MKTILLIEDDPIVSHIYRNRLEKENFKVEVSMDGEVGYARIQELKPDAVLLDLMLPKMNGVEILRKVRNARAFAHLPIIVFSNAYMPNMVSDAWSSGASAVYNKATVTPRQIIDGLDHMLPGRLRAPLSNGESLKQAAPALPARRFPSLPAREIPAIVATEDAFDSQLRQEFLKNAIVSVGELRKIFNELSKGSDQALRRSEIERLYEKVRAFSNNAGAVGMVTLAKLGSALEALLKEMMDSPETFTASTLRTTAHALDAVRELARYGVPVDLAENPPINILVVDDEPLSRRAIVAALEKAFLKPSSAGLAETALEMAQKTQFDIIFLDIQMPGMDGLQLCESLRQKTANVETPIVFVTASTDFQIKAQCILRRASDLIAKPFLFVELAVKALTIVLRHRLQDVKAPVFAPAGPGLASQDYDPLSRPALTTD